MIKAVVFDMDGVLFDTERISIETWFEIGQKENISLSKLEDAVYGCIGLNREDAASFLRECLGDAFDVEAFRDKTIRAFEQKLQKEGLPLMKGVIEILEFLKANKFPVAIASSTSQKTIKSHLEKTGLTEYFNVIVGGDMVKHSKPLPDIYLLACDRLGAAPEESMAIEDSPNGIYSASRAGMMTVMVPDMVEPTPELEALLYGRCETLFDVIELIKNN